MSPAGCAGGPSPAPARPPRGRWRVITARACIAISFACLLLLVAYPPLRHHAAARGAGIAASAVVSILGSLAYLRSRR